MCTVWRARFKCEQQPAEPGPQSARFQGNVDQDLAFSNFGGGRFGTTAFLLDAPGMAKGAFQ
jgi:hypothetical protein